MARRDTSAASNDVILGKVLEGYEQELAAYEHFAAIDEGKRQRIITTALAEFAAHDYAHVSTNAIVVDAGISKGLLFYYFGSKAGLFFYLYTFVVRRFTGAIREQASLASGDVFEVLKQLTETKLVVTMKYPLETAFFVRALQGDLTPELRAAVDTTVLESFDTLTLITERLDQRALKDGLTREQAIKIINWVVAGLVNEVLSDLDPQPNAQQLGNMTRYCNDHLDVLRRLFYKK